MTEKCCFSALLYERLKLSEVYLYVILMQFLPGGKKNMAGFWLNFTQRAELAVISYLENHLSHRARFGLNRCAICDFLLVFDIVYRSMINAFGLILFQGLNQPKSRISKTNACTRLISSLNDSEHAFSYQCFIDYMGVN
jgi:hypothetical protein